MKGLYLARFRAGSSEGEGMVIVRGNEILGGDLAHTWAGTLEEDGSHLFARIRVVPCMSRNERGPLARERTLMTTLTGSGTEKDALLSGHVDDSDIPVRLEMHKAA